MEIDRIAPELDRIIDSNAPFDRVVHGIHFGEGPVWDKKNKRLVFVDIIGDTIWSWKPGVGKEVILNPSVKANGLALDLENRIVVAGWGGRTVWRFEKDGSLKTLASHYQGKKINSPNDIVVRNDGQIYFTDSPGGMLNVGMVGYDLQKYLDIQGVYRIALDGTLHLVTDDFVYPNGLCFSPDEKILYANGSRDKTVRAYDVQADDTLTNSRMFFDLSKDTRPGITDGMKVDTAGNVYTTGPGGIHIVSPQGKLLGRLLISEHCTNFCWGDDDWRSMYITSHESVFRTRIKIPGIATW